MPGCMCGSKFTISCYVCSMLFNKLIRSCYTPGCLIRQFDWEPEAEGVQCVSWLCSYCADRAQVLEALDMRQRVVVGLYLDPPTSPILALITCFLPQEFNCVREQRLGTMRFFLLGAPYTKNALNDLRVRSNEQMYYRRAWFPGTADMITYILDFLL